MITTVGLDATGGSNLDHPSASMVTSFDVLGIGVSAVNMALALSTIEGWLNSRQPNFVCVRDVHGVMASQRDEELFRIHQRAGLITPDGMPLVWLGRLRGFRDVDRVYGPELMVECCRHFAKRGCRHFFYGGREGVADRLADRLSDLVPGLRVVGTYTPPFRPLSEDEDRQVVDLINEASPDFVWVGLSTPKQEYWMADHVERLRGAVLLGVGAAFDFVSGEKRQAPRWMQRSGLEWCFRLATEPRRLGPRYLINNPLFIGAVMRQALSGKGS